MNEWGTPDWHDAAAYGDVNGWTFDRWRWEFYRRRDDLREYFDARAEETYQHWQQYADKPGFPVAHLRPDEPGFCVIVDVEARKRFGYSPLPNPRIGDQPEMTIWPHEHDGHENYIEGDSAGLNGFRGTFGELLAMADVVLTEEQKFLLSSTLASRPAPLKASEMAVTFDLDRALKPQIAHARETLRWHQADIHGKPLQKRRNPARWLGYLRALDAREAGASWAEIAETFYAQGLLDRRKSAGQYCAPPPQAARDMWDAADALRFNF